MLRPRNTTNRATASASAMPRVSATNYTFKVVMVGDQYVGKTCLATRYRSDAFVHEASTIGANFVAGTVMADGAVLNLQIWDTPGMRQFRAMMPLFYLRAKGVVVVYDCTNMQSFDNVPFWLQHSRTHLKGDVDLMLLGNKCDCRERQVPTRVAAEMARARGVDFFETSAKDGTNVVEAFCALARAMKKREDDSRNGANTTDAIELDNSSAGIVRCF